MIRLLKYFFILIGILLFFTTCKKYPENTLWFKNPTKIVTRGNFGNISDPTVNFKPWKLDYYSVDGIDSTNSSFLNVYKEEGIFIYIDGSIRKGSYSLKCLDVLFASWELEKPKKIIHFNASDLSLQTNSIENPIYQNQRNIFMYSHLPSKILKLTKEQFWIQLEFNSISYEIHFK